MALLTLVYVASTLWLVALARWQLRQAAILERSRVRPFVILELVLDPPIILVSVKNIGQTPAFDVKFNVSPNIETLHGGKGMYPSIERVAPMSFIANGIAMLPPQREISGMVGTWVRVKEVHPALRFGGFASYKGPDGVSYSDPFIADLSIYEDLLRPASKDIHDVAKELEEISTTLRRISDNVREPLVRTIPEAEFQARQREFVEQARRSIETPGAPPVQPDGDAVEPS